MNFAEVLKYLNMGDKFMNESQIMVLELGSKGYSCAQILFVGALRLFGEENNLLIRAMSALSQGGGNLGKTCGALSGGLCLLSLYSGKGDDFETPLENEPLLWDELITWFEAEFSKNNDISCDSLLGFTQNKTHTSQGDRMRQNAEHCGVIVAKTWDKCQEILQAHGINPFDPRQERL